jgi:hypothetical protein
MFALIGIRPLNRIPDFDREVLRIEFEAVSDHRDFVYGSFFSFGGHDQEKSQSDQNAKTSPDDFSHCRTPFKTRFFKSISNGFCIVNPLSLGRKA